ncbi:type 1 glutamine amidotransferase domain-containing protein [Micromonosporaceae bacterium B7E4]
MRGEGHDNKRPVRALWGGSLDPERRQHQGGGVHSRRDGSAPRGVRAKWGGHQLRIPRGSATKPGSRRPRVEPGEPEWQILRAVLRLHRAGVAVAAEAGRGECCRLRRNHDSRRARTDGGPLPGPGDGRRLLSAAVESGTVIAAVCHGPAALLSATDPDGGWLFAGRRVTALDNEEEKLYGTMEKAPFLLESRLVELGARFEHGPPWLPYVVADERLITGQNPASAGAVTNAILTMCDGHGG